MSITRVLKRGAKIFCAIWIASLLALGVSYLLLYLGQTSIAEFVAMVSTGTLVLSTVLLLPLGLGAIIATILSRRSRSQTSLVSNQWLFCPQCGNKVQEGAQYCARCGRKVESEAHAD